MSERDRRKRNKKWEHHNHTQPSHQKPSSTGSTPYQRVSKVLVYGMEDCIRKIRTIMIIVIIMRGPEMVAMLCAIGYTIIIGSRASIGKTADSM